MRYVIYKVLQRLKRNWRWYAILVLELSIGTAILISGINSKWSMDIRLSQLKSQTESGMLGIEPHIMTTETANPIPYPLFQKISSEYPNGELCYLAISQDMILWGDYNTAVAVVYVSAPLFQWWFGMDAEPQTAYYGNGLLLENGSTAAFSQLLIDSGTITTENQTSFVLKQLENKKGRGEIAFSALEGDGFLPDKTIFLPADAILETASPDIRVKLVILAQDAVEASEVGYRVSTALHKANPQYMYAVNDPLEQAKKGIDDLTGTICTLTFLSSVSFVIVAVGMLGTLLILLQRRRKDTAIFLMLGASFPMVVFELLLEVFVVCVSGCGIGSLCAMLITPLLSVSYQTVVFHPATLLLALALALAITFAACTLALLSVRNRHPFQTL